MGLRGPPANSLRDYVIVLYRRGQLATLHEGALIAGVSRSRVHAWLRVEGINWVRQRQSFVAMHMAHASLPLERRKGSHLKKKARAESAKAEWNRRHKAKENGNEPTGARSEDPPAD
jgi:hypothetical protein